MDRQFIITQIINAVIVILTTVITLRVTRPSKNQGQRLARDYATLTIALVACGLIGWRLVQLSNGGSVPLIAAYAALLVAYGLFLIARLGQLGSRR